ncbi:flagellar transcriptional regulator FlhD [Biostraticola tofi]|uniref:Flagellar transcriptional regulator FlhD n=1 Tax=Biostraticola tofi TaxID=466109 RepID=A0A4R3YVT4_9GAMM|nr:flagellar transcriptional regulator FlhD [Biostraticola tofi]TCV95524.1 flagellar transcriptional activator FlhD [Biostraticola tofi]
MSCENLLRNIHEVNLSYLLLAQALINQDKAAARFRLGLNEETINVLSTLSYPNLIKLGELNQLICQLRIDNKTVISCLTKESRVDDLQHVHTGIILSTQYLDSIDSLRTAQHKG